jgi:hypothetical protein
VEIRGARALQALEVEIRLSPTMRARRSCAVWASGSAVRAQEEQAGTEQEHQQEAVANHFTAGAFAFDGGQHFERRNASDPAPAVTTLHDFERRPVVGRARRASPSDHGSVDVVASMARRLR